MPRGIPNAGRQTQLTPQARGAMTRKANLAARGATAAANKTTANKAATKTATASAGNTTGKRAGAKSHKRKQSKNAGRDAGEERVRPIERQQTLTETIANIAIHASQDMGTVRRVLQATQRVAEGHLCRAGSGKINVPYIGVQLYRAQRSARPARDMNLFKTGRMVHVGRTPARAVTRARVLATMRDATLR